MFCTQCGKPSPESAKFCQSCGAVITSESEPGATGAVKPNHAGLAPVEPVPGVRNPHWRIRLFWLKGWAEAIDAIPSRAEYRGLTELQKFDLWSWVGYMVVSILMLMLSLAAGVFSPVSQESSRYETVGQAGFAYCLIQLGLYLYLLPTSIAVGRQRPNRMAIFALDFLLGWTLVGWAVSLCWALTSKDG